MEDKELKEKEEKLQKEANNLTEIDIAELANKELRKKEEEINKLKKELAQSKLYSVAEEEDSEPMSREECIKVIGDSHTNNYDYAEAVCELVDYELSIGNPNPLGKNGDDVYKFFKDVLEECSDDKSRFASIYQARIGQDDPQIAMAYKNRNK